MNKQYTSLRNINQPMVYFALNKKITNSNSIFLWSRINDINRICYSNKI